MRSCPLTPPHTTHSPSAAQLNMRDAPHFQGPSNDQSEEQPPIAGKLGKSFSCSPAGQLQTPETPVRTQEDHSVCGTVQNRDTALILSEAPLEGAELCPSASEPLAVLCYMNK